MTVTCERWLFVRAVGEIFFEHGLQAGHRHDDLDRRYHLAACRCRR